MTGDVNSQEQLLHERETTHRRLDELEDEVEELRRSEAKFRLAAESLPTAMVMVNEQGQIVLVNAQTEKLFGYSREELLGQPVEMLVSERFRDNHRSHRNDFFV
ncbi:MAG: PAS domain S-box protein, partial [Planctomycetaceae bacterium]|nr:PAS domain S-box protein [Planctomycetaceae bacterium]